MKRLLQYLKRPLPLTSFETYEDYWQARVELGNAERIFPRFNIVQQMLSKDARILDYGCGYGTFLRHLSEHDFTDLHGTDLHTPKSLPEGVTFHTLEQLHEQAPFDTITLLQVAEHVVEAEILIEDLLTLGREVFLSIPNTGFWHHRVRLASGRVPITDVIFHMKEHVRLWTLTDFLETCQRHHWEVEAVIPTVPHESILAQRWPSLFAKQILFVLSKR